MYLVSAFIQRISLYPYHDPAQTPAFLLQKILQILQRPGYLLYILHIPRVCPLYGLSEKLCRGSGKLREIPGNGTVQEITDKVMATLEA